MVKNTDDLYQIFSEEEINERKNQIKKKQNETSQKHFIKKAQETADRISRENSGAARVIITKNPRKPIIIPIMEEVIEETIDEIVEEILEEAAEEEEEIVSEPEPIPEPPPRTKEDTINEIEAILKKLKGE